MPVHIPFYKIFNIYTRHSVNKFPGKLILITLFLFFNEEWFVIRHWQPIYSSLLSQSECTTFDIHKLKETIYTKKKQRKIFQFSIHIYTWTIIKIRREKKNSSTTQIRRCVNWLYIIRIYSNWFCIHQQWIRLNFTAWANLLS